MRGLLAAVALLALALPLARAYIREIPQQLAWEESLPGLSSPAPEAVLGRKGGGGCGGPLASGSGAAPALGSGAPPPPDTSATVLGAGSSGDSGADAGSSGGADATTPAAGGSEFDLTTTLFNGNAQAFTQAVLASGTSSAAIAIAGMLQLPDITTIKTLKECLAGPEPGASAVEKAVTAAFQMSACQTPQLSQDATAAAVSGGGLLAAAAARGLARAAMQCCSKVAEHLAGALLSLEAGTSFVGDLDSALKATGSSLPACALPSQLGG